jgi:hypothetical protein
VDQPTCKRTSREKDSNYVSKGNQSPVIKACFHSTYRDQYVDIITGNPRLESGLIHSSFLFTATVVSVTVRNVSYDCELPVVGVPLEATIIYQLCGLFAVSSFSLLSYDNGN